MGCKDGEAHGVGRERRRPCVHVHAFVCVRVTFLEVGKVMVGWREFWMEG